MPEEPTREALLDGIAKGGFDFGGVKLNYAATNNRGMDEVFFTVLQSDGTFRPVSRLLKTSGR
jgi:branched-chain amino acid transport system substrate-binding protein